MKSNAKRRQPLVRRTLLRAALVLALALLAGGAAHARPASRVLLIPLDDRPPCLQMPVRLGLLADIEVVSPPRELLGRFTEPGRPDAIAKWLGTQDLRSFDAAIVSFDMLAYGGLVAMREFDTDEATALRRAALLRSIRRRAPKMPIYGSSVIMRLAPTGNAVNEAYRVDLARWAEISVDPSMREETGQLERRIPADALERYKKARSRDLRLNNFAVDLVREKVVDYLILSQDDARPTGVHIADREQLLARTAALGLGAKIAVQPGADEVSMLLLARAASEKYAFHPKFRVSFSDDRMAERFMPYEDRPLRETVGFHIRAIGGVEVPAGDTRTRPDLDFFVYTSRGANDAAENFSRRVAASERAVVADIDPKGDVQGADPAFARALMNAARGDARPGAFFVGAGYASWNTAGNTIGTALPQGLLAAIGARLAGSRKPQTARRIRRAHDWFILQRLIDDYAYHTVVRPKALGLIRAKNWSALRLDAAQTAEVEAFCRRELAPSIAEITAAYAGRDGCRISPVSFYLPWNRTFEAEIDFSLECPAK